MEKNNIENLRRITLQEMDRYNRHYFEHDHVELIFVFDMECWLHLDFKTHEFKSGDLDDMIELLSVEAMLEFCEEEFAA